jgi:hypothetical protein
MRDPDETIQAIDEAVEGYVTWSGLSEDAAHWSAEHVDRPDEALPPGMVWGSLGDVYASSDSGDPLRCAVCGDQIGVEPFGLEMSTGIATHTRCGLAPAAEMPQPGRAFMAPLGTPLPSGEVEDPWREVGAVVGEFEAGLVEVSSSPMSWSQDTVTMTIRADVSRFAQQLEQMRGAFAAVAEVVKQPAARRHAKLAPLLYMGEYRRHRRTCRLCNPNAGPKPLPINGAEYARRRKARTRRNRR